MPTVEGPDTAPAQAPPRRRSILFVCTGNTCRSPLAETLCKRVLANRLGCGPDELERHGFIVRSAGVAAFHGDGPSGTAIQAAAEYGADLSAHRSRPVSQELLADATDIVTMTQSHAAVLAYRFPGIGPELSLLCGPDDDLPDPIGGDLEVYRACTRIIHDRLEQLADRWLTKTTDSLPSTGDAGE